MENDINDVFAKNLDFYMKKHEIKQEKVMEITKSSQAAVSDWLNGKKYPRMDRIQKLADYFGIDKSDLIEERKEGDVDQDIKIISRDMKEMTKEQRATLLRVARTIFKED